MPGRPRLRLLIRTTSLSSGVRASRHELACECDIRGHRAALVGRQPCHATSTTRRRGPRLHRVRCRHAVAVGVGGRGAVLPARRPLLRRPRGRRTATSTGAVGGRADPALYPRRRGQRGADRRRPAAWRAAGTHWVGGTLAGVRSKLGLPRRLGVTAMWISPVLKQAAPRRATGELPRLRDAGLPRRRPAVRRPPRTCAGWSRTPTRRAAGDPRRRPEPRGRRVRLRPRRVFDARWDGREYPVAGWRTARRARAVHPRPLRPPGRTARCSPAELHAPESFTRRGGIGNWDHHPEYVEGDFWASRTSSTAAGRSTTTGPRPALEALTRAYCWWLGFADLDGFRVDTVKHMDPGPRGTSPRSSTSSRSRWEGPIPAGRRDQRAARAADRDDGADRARRGTRARRGAVAAGRGRQRERKTPQGTSRCSATPR